MRCGIVINAGDPATLAELAAEAEAAGWDGAFYYDAIAIGDGEMYDPWVVLAAMAMRTSRVRLGLIVTPPSRRRPWKLAREAMTIDRLSGGRLVLPVGLGATDDSGFGNVGEPTDARTRAELLDETLDILVGLWSGEPFAYAGAHYRFGPMTFRPTPVQRPRIPIWVVGAWPHERSMRRTLRWDGVVAQVSSAEELAAMAAWLREHRRPDLDIAMQGETPADDPAAAAAAVRPFEEAGATWWLEAAWGEVSVEAVRRRCRAGPPKVR